MKPTSSLAAAALSLAALSGLETAPAAAQAAAEPYKLGMFRDGERAFVGLVLDDALVVDVAGAGVSVPATLQELVAGWDSGLEQRLSRLAAEARARRPAAARERSSLKTLVPIAEPHAILNAAVNYAEHGAEMGPRLGDAPAAKVPDPIPGLWPRRPGDTRQNPYLFLKSRTALAADGEPILIPRERERVDWECELAVVIGRTVKHATPEQARDAVFGFTLMNDVSDRGGRGDGRHGSDWLIGKSHDSFAPLGPFVVPARFVKDPQKLAIRFTLNGQVMQDSNTDRMTHNIYEVVSYASNILTLRPGDILATGSPAGVGTARATPIYMKPGDTAVCTIEGIGTLTNPVRAEP